MGPCIYFNNKHNSKFKCKFDINSNYHLSKPQHKINQIELLYSSFRSSPSRSTSSSPFCKQTFTSPPLNFSSFSTFYTYRIAPKDQYRNPPLCKSISESSILS